MTQAVEKYANMLRELKIPADVVDQALDIFQTVPVLLEQFKNPTADLAGKHRVVDKIFPTEIRDVIKIMCDNQKSNCSQKYARHIEKWDGKNPAKNGPS